MSTVARRASELEGEYPVRRGTLTTEELADLARRTRYTKGAVAAAVGALELAGLVEVLRIGSIVLVALLTGAAVAFTGIIAFVGLVVPHLIRMIIGPAHRGLILASAVGGGALLVVADLMTRTLVAGAELPIGMLTSLVGGPFFFWLLYRQRRRSGGWA